MPITRIHCALLQRRPRADSTVSAHVADHTSSHIYVARGWEEWPLETTPLDQHRSNQADFVFTVDSLRLFFEHALGGPNTRITNPSSDAFTRVVQLLVGLAMTAVPDPERLQFVQDEVPGHHAMVRHIFIPVQLPDKLTMNPTSSMLHLIDEVLDGVQRPLPGPMAAYPFIFTPTRHWLTSSTQHLRSVMAVARSPVLEAAIAPARWLLDNIQRFFDSYVLPPLSSLTRPTVPGSDPVQSAPSGLEVKTQSELSKLLPDRQKDQTMIGYLMTFVNVVGAHHQEIASMERRTYEKWIRAPRVYDGFSAGAYEVEVQTGYPTQAWTVQTLISRLTRNDPTLLRRATQTGLYGSTEFPLDRVFWEAYLQPQDMEPRMRRHNAFPARYMDALRRTITVLRIKLSNAYPISLATLLDEDGEAAYMVRTVRDETVPQFLDRQISALTLSDCLHDSGVQKWLYEAHDTIMVQAVKVLRILSRRTSIDMASLYSDLKNLPFFGPKPIPNSDALEAVPHFCSEVKEITHLRQMLIRLHAYIQRLHPGVDFAAANGTVIAQVQFFPDTHDCNQFPPKVQALYAALRGVAPSGTPDMMTPIAQSPEPTVLAVAPTRTPAAAPVPAPSAEATAMKDLLRTLLTETVNNSAAQRHLTQQLNDQDRKMQLFHEQQNALARQTSHVTALLSAPEASSKSLQDPIPVTPSSVETPILQVSAPAPAGRKVWRTFPPTKLSDLPTLLRDHARLKWGITTDDHPRYRSATEPCIFCERDHPSNTCIAAWAQTADAVKKKGNAYSELQRERLTVQRCPGGLRSEPEPYSG